MRSMVGEVEREIVGRRGALHILPELLEARDGIVGMGRAVAVAEGDPGALAELAGEA